MTLTSGSVLSTLLTTRSPKTTFLMRKRSSLCLIPKPKRGTAFSPPKAFCQRFQKSGIRTTPNLVPSNLVPKARTKCNLMKGYGKNRKSSKQSLIFLTAMLHRLQRTGASTIKGELVKADGGFLEIGQSYSILYMYIIEKCPFLLATTPCQSELN
mmetsp:Transcript_30114/g.58966  ORF Transcript_30114/g.58966 Transcript_30114/m.58966 type:complete len:155 (-) Transcript_30114:194-658(-)